MRHAHAIELLRKSCWHCEHYDGLALASGAVRCLHRGRLQIMATPLGGCAFFTRVPGSDDTLRPPAGFSMAGLGPVRRDEIEAALAWEAGQP